MVTTDQDFAAAKRRQFCTRIATGDWDAVIIGDSQFKMIPMSTGYQHDFFQQEVDQLTEIIEQDRTRSGKDSWSVKALERARRTIEGKIKKLMDTGRKDSVITFEELGIDRLFVDESHLFKNCAKRCA